VSPASIALIASIIGVAGTLLGALGGVWLGHFLSGRSQRRQFVMQSRTEEYRVLLNTLGSCVREVKELKNFSLGPAGATPPELQRRWADQKNLNERIHSALFAASQALNDRLFIGDAIEKHHIRQCWREIDGMAHRPRVAEAFSPGGESFDTAEFERAWIELARKIRGIANEDL